MDTPQHRRPTAPGGGAWDGAGEEVAELMLYGQPLPGAARMHQRRGMARSLGAWGLCSMDRTRSRAERWPAPPCSSQGQEAKAIMEAGQFVPTSLVLGEQGGGRGGGRELSRHGCAQRPRLILSALPLADLLHTAMLDSGSDKFLVDGFPRKLDQLQEFEERVRGPTAFRAGSVLRRLAMV